MNTDLYGFRPIPGYSQYLVSDKGDVWFITKAKMKKQTRKPDGYLCVSIIPDDDGFHSVNVHRLVALAFIPNPHGKYAVNHKNGIKTDNRVENLEWVTRSENARHAVENGLYKIRAGSSHHFAKLSWADVDQMRKLRAGGMTRRQVADLFPAVKYMHVCCILRGASWKNETRKEAA